MESSDIDVLILDFLSGDLNQEGSRRLWEWVCQSDENQRIWNQYNDIWQATASEKLFEQVDVHRRWLEVQSRIQKRSAQPV